ncbi:MAG: hypothetical protein JRM87_02850, partial [Nitrososphaerota archaeon]|nr:hypothetical protein [Nitrososphaerota archaeon]
MELLSKTTLVVFVIVVSEPAGRIKVLIPVLLASVPFEKYIVVLLIRSTAVLEGLYILTIKFLVILEEFTYS